MEKGPFPVRLYYNMLDDTRVKRYTKERIEIAMESIVISGNRIMKHQRDSNSHPMRKDISRVSVYVCGMAAAVVFLAAGMFTLISGGNGGQSTFQASTGQVLDSWTDAAGNKVTLPVKFPYSQKGAYTLHTIVPEQNIVTKDLSLLVSAKYLNVTLFLDGQEIGRCFCKPEGFKKTIGKTFLLTQLPKDAAGKELRIEAVPLLGAGMEYEMNVPQLGSGEGLVTDLVSSDLLILIILEAIFCFGLMLMLFSWQARTTSNSTFLQIGLFAVLFAMYSLAITDTIHLFLDNSRFIYVMEFLLLALFPLPLLILVYHVCLPRFRPALLTAAAVLSINFCLQTILYFFTELELRDTVQITHLLMALSAFVLIPALALSGRQGSERFRLLVSFSPVILGALWDLLLFYLPGTNQKAAGFQLGVLLFIFLQTVYLVQSYLESDLYRKVAYTDALTGLQNRTAFEEQIVQLEKNSSHYASVWCVCADVNNLKGVNDTLGHGEGDRLICGAAKVLSEAKTKDSDLYRTGGDEFVVFAYNQSESSMEQGRIRFEAALLRYNQSHNVPLRIALGYDCLDKEDTITKLISRADSIMYEDKRRKKQGKQEAEDLT